MDILMIFSGFVELSFPPVPGCCGPGLFRPGSFRPILGVGHFGLGRWVISAPSHFGQFQYGRVYKHGLIYIYIFLGGVGVVKVNVEMDRKIDR